MNDTEREVNPFGFIVTSWQADREIREANNEKHHSLSCWR
jgi:type IV secretory pathway component VirB8